jgi:hypothetical protein
MSTIKDGGPAFPRTYNGDGHNGATLRDYFAAKAMQGLIAQGGASVQKHVAEGVLIIPARQGIPLLAYEYADAMLAAREAQS